MLEPRLLVLGWLNTSRYSNQHYFNTNILKPTLTLLDKEQLQVKITSTILVQHTEINMTENFIGCSKQYL